MMKKGQRPSRHERNVRFGKRKARSKVKLINPGIKKKNFGAKFWQGPPIKLRKSALRQDEILKSLSFNKKALELPDLPPWRRRQIEREIDDLQERRFGKHIFEEEKKREKKLGLFGKSEGELTQIQRE